MLKKIALTGIFAASATFASWDLFPVLPKNQGEAHTGLAYNETNYASCLTMFAGARFSVIQNLELGVMVPFRFYTELHGTEMDDVNGLGNIEASIRYQFIPKMNAFFDVAIPVGDDSYNVEDEWTLKGGFQFSSILTPTVNFGSELGVQYETEGERNYSELAANISAELDFTVVPHYTPYIRSTVSFIIGIYDDSGFDSFLGKNTPVGTWITVGSKFDITEWLNLDASYGVGIGDHLYGPNRPKTYGLGLNFRF